LPIGDSQPLRGDWLQLLSFGDRESLQSLELFDGDHHNNRSTVLVHCDRLRKRRVEHKPEAVLGFLG
jgi:hypothetical protein